MGFLWIPLNPKSLTCGLTAAEATQGKEQGKEHVADHLWKASSFELLDAAVTGARAGARPKRIRTTFKCHELQLMKTYFELNHNPDNNDLKQLSLKTGLSKRVLQASTFCRRSHHLSHLI